MSLKYFNRIQDHEVAKALRNIVDSFNGVETVATANAAAIAGIHIPTIAEIQKSLSIGGSNPINITGLQGTLANPQIAAILGLFANRPGPTTVAPGTIYYATDQSTAYISTGTAWDTITRRILIGGFYGIFTFANSADRTYTLPDATGNLTYETAPLTNNNFLFGGGNALVKDSGFAVVPVANGGTGITYNRIADTIALTGQTADILATNFNGVVTPGTYRVSYSLQDTTADVTAGAVTLTVAYTDGAGATTKTATQVLTALGRADGVFFLQAASGNVTWAISHSGIFATSQYALYICFERLS